MVIFSSYEVKVHLVESKTKLYLRLECLLHHNLEKNILQEAKLVDILLMAYLFNNYNLIMCYY